MYSVYERGLPMIIDDVMMVMIVMVGLAGMGVWRARKRYGSSEK